MSARLLSAGALAATLLVAVACGSGPVTGSGAPGSGSPSSGSPSASAAAPSPSLSAALPALVLKVTSEGGLINPAASLNALPIVEVFSDGRILTPGAVDAIFPGPLLSPVDVRNVGPDGATAILAAIQAAGLDKAIAAGPGIPGDSGSDTFSVTIDGQTIENRLAGGGPATGGHGAGGSVEPGRAAAFALLDRLLDPAETWGSSPVATSHLQPAGYRVFAIPGGPQVDPATPRPPVAWPLATPLATFGAPAIPDRGIAGLRQGVVFGADAATLGPVLNAATSETGFTSGGATWTLAVRVLLPDEISD
jgi:hypothetical protein